MKNKYEKGFAEFLLLIILFLMGLMVYFLFKMTEFKKKEGLLIDYIGVYINENKEQNCFKDGINSILVNNIDNEILVFVNDCEIKFKNKDDLEFEMMRYKLLKSNKELKLDYYK